MTRHARRPTFRPSMTLLTFDSARDFGKVLSARRVTYLVTAVL
jgi:hypothetical protein